jgi:hypothetical protein
MESADRVTASGNCEGKQDGSIWVPSCKSRISCGVGVCGKDARASPEIFSYDEQGVLFCPVRWAAHHDSPCDPADAKARWWCKQDEYPLALDC